MYCENCGTELEDAERFCHACGTERSSQNAEAIKLLAQELESQDKPHPRLLSAMVIWLVYVVLLLIAGYLIIRAIRWAWDTPIRDILP